MYDISLPPGIKGFSVVYFFGLRILIELSITTFIFSLTFCFYSPSDLFQKIVGEAGLTVSWTERLLRYFYRIFTLRIAALPCLTRKKSKPLGVLPLTSTDGAYGTPQFPAAILRAFGTSVLLLKKTDAPNFFCIISWLGVFNKTNTLFHARLMSEIFTLCKIIFNTALGCWIYLRRVTNYLGDKFLILNKKDWNSYSIFRIFQVLNTEVLRNWLFLSKNSYLFRYWNQF